MKPPTNCTLCSKDLDADEATLIVFQLSPSDEKWKERISDPHWTGHPPNAFWFCNKCTTLAKKFEHLTSDEALQKINHHMKNKSYGKG